MQRAMCEAPWSGRSSRSTVVKTTYFKARFLTVSASFFGSLASSTPGFFADLTEQNLQPRVHVSPISMKVAVPPFQHSPMLGQFASSQTVLRLRFAARFLIHE